MKTIAMLFSVVAVCCVASVANADDSNLQLRGVAGVALLDDQGSGSSSVSGGALDLGGYVGYAVVPNVYVGGFVGDTYAPAPSLSFSGHSYNLANTNLNLLSLDPYIDWRPGLANAEGLHLLGQAGYSNLAINAGGTGHDGNGLNFGVGVGYDWRVGDCWSMGVLGRFTYSPTFFSVGKTGYTENTVAPALLFSVSYR